MENNLYHYTAFGKKIVSDFPFPELLSTEVPERADLTIKHARIPPALPDAIAVDACFQINAEHFLFNLDEIVRCFGGQGIVTVDSNSKGSLEIQRLMILGPIMAALGIWDGCLPINGSCIAVDGKAVLLMGSRDVGKSSVLAALCKSGYPIIADDLLLVYPNEQGRYYVLPSYPRLKLWPDVLEQLGITSESLPHIHPESSKRSWWVGEQFYPDPLPLDVGIVLRFSKEGGIGIKELDGGTTLRGLTTYIYVKHLVKAVLGDAALFGHCVSIANQMKTYLCKRNIFDIPIRELANTIEDIWR